MNNGNTRASSRAIRGASAFTLALGLVFSTILFPIASFASTGVAAPALQANTGAVTVPAGGSVNLTVRGFCLNYGKPFPTGQVSATGLGKDNVREALNYAIQKGYTSSDARQVELAIWNLSDGTWHADPHVIGTEIANNATAANMPAAGTAGTSLADAITQGKVTVSGTFTPQTSDEFYGDGQVTVKNTGTADLSVYMPIGVVFSAGASGGFQDLLAYQLTAPAQATGTVSGTASPGITATSVLTGTASPQVTVTSVVTGTASPEASATSVVTGTASPEASATSVVTGTSTVAATTPSTEATSTTAVETPTAAATVAAATNTPVVVATDTPVATATTPAGGNVLPQTGNGSGPNGFAMAILFMGLILTAAGSAALVANKRRA